MRTMVIIACSMLAVLGAALVGKAALKAPRMPVQEAARLLEQNEAVFIDIRREAAWQSSDAKIKTAVRRNYKLAENWVREYPRDATIVVYDESSHESLSAMIALELIREGYDRSYALKGGWSAWVDAGLPIEKK